jgi:ribosomal protein S18 acetylase RimI-like enzyme
MKPKIPIRLGCAEDAEAIYKLKTEAFGAGYLRYTIYLAPESVRYLRDLLAQGPAQSRHSIYVACQSREIIGYYEVIHSGDDFLLNYIGVTDRAKGSGLGNHLLNHFEQTGAVAGCRRFTLDVFDSNIPARDWYWRRGYRTLASSFQVCLPLGFLDSKEAPVLDFRREDWEAALREELLRGFSKVTCRCGPGTVTVGLIAGRVSKLLSREGVDLQSAVASIDAHLRDQRENLILAGLPEIPAEWVGLPSEKVLRLAKSVQS